MILRSILDLSKRGIQCHNNLPQRSRPRWNLALVTNLNTPSQLGTIPPVKPSATVTDHKAIQTP